MTAVQLDMLRCLVENEASGGKTVRDVGMMISFGPQWRRTALSLEHRGFIGANRNGWFVTKEGKEEAKRRR